MPRTRTVVDCARWREHQALARRGAATDHLAPHTTTVAFSADEDAQAAAEAAAARAQREARHAARQKADDDRALLREHGSAHPDPVVAAACRLLAGQR